MRDVSMNAVNTKGVFFGMKHQIRQLLVQDGDIVLNVASMAGLGGSPKLATYGASRLAVVSLTKTKAVEYAPKNIRVDAICPFYSLTPMFTDFDIEGKQEFIAQGGPMKRLAATEEIVEVMPMLIAPGQQLYERPDHRRSGRSLGPLTVASKSMPRFIS